jgi:hypothetical protein
VEEGLLKSEKLDTEVISRRKPTIDEPKRDFLRNTWSWTLQAALLTCSFTLFVLSRYREPSDAECTRKLFPYCE